MVLPQSKSKITSAVWGPLDEMIVTGHENGDLVQWNVTVRIFIYTQYSFLLFLKQFLKYTHIMVTLTY